jgi:hypothetical protein
MKSNIIRKSMICGIIILFFGISVIPTMSWNVVGGIYLSISETSNVSRFNSIYYETTEDLFLDLAVTSYDDSICVLLGDGIGGFGNFQQYMVGVTPTDIIVGDYNRDGGHDLAVTNPGDNDISILFGDGNGGFGDRQDYPVGEMPVGVTSDDFDMDGNLDLAVTNTFDYDVSVLLGDGSGGFGDRQDYDVGVRPGFIVSDDFNLDDVPDLAVANRDDNDVTVLLGDGTGGFGDRQDYPVGGGANDVISGDFDLDYAPDLAVTNPMDNDVTILLGDGTGGFGYRQDYLVGLGPAKLVAGDFDSDDVLDLATTNGGDYNVSVLLGDGSGGFGDRQDYGVGTIPYDIAFGDFDMDENLDLAVTNFLDKNVSVLLGDGTGVFGDRQDYPVADYPTSLVVGNFNYRKDPDLDCYGELMWSDIEPGDTVIGNFTVMNIGDSGSWLDWEIESKPDWGTWTMIPEEGYDLTPEYGPHLVEVSVVAPDEHNQQFTGEIKITNKENDSDFCTVDVSLLTLFKPELEIKGGFGVNVIIKNSGDVDATDVKWEIHVEGGLLGMINKTTNGTVDIQAGESQKVSSGMLFGLGNINVKANVANKEKIATGMQIIILTMINK